MNAGAAIRRREVETDARREVVFVPGPLAFQKRKNQRIKFVDTTDILDVRVQLVTQTEIQSELRMHAPIVLHETGEVVVVRVGQHQRAIGKTAAQRYGEQQIVIVNMPVAVAIEVREVFDQFDAALLKHFQIEIGCDALKLAAGVERVVAANQRVRVGELKPPLLRSLRHAERRAVLQTGKRKLWAGRHRQRVVEKSAEAEVETVDVARRDDARVVAEQRVRLVQARLPLRRGTDCAHQRAGGDAFLALKRVAKVEAIVLRRTPVNAIRC